MTDQTRIAASGAWGRIVWAVDNTGDMPARAFYEQLSDKDKAKVNVLFQRLAESGFISNREHFKKLGPKAGHAGKDLWEFKRFQVRFLGDFRPGSLFVIAHGTRKKRDDLRKEDIEKAVRILAEHDTRG